MSLRKYLFYFANEHIDFRLPEITAVAALFKIPLKWIELPKTEPFWVVELPTDKSAQLIASRSVCVRRIIHLWGSSDSDSDLRDQLTAQEDMIKSYFSPTKTFKIKVDTYGNHQTHKQKLDKIESFSFLPIEGTVKLKNPDTTLQYFEHYGMDPNSTPDKPVKVYFGKVVAKGRRDLMSELNLKKRKFIGNTSMDAQLSLIMANIAQVKSGDFVLDPFVGSGSLMIAAASFGGYVCGTDIDFLMLHAKTKPTRKQDRLKGRDQDESVFANFSQYKLESQYVDVVVADASLPLWREQLVFDAIITDPPYGIREAMEKVGTSRENVSISEENAASHIPSKTAYDMDQLVSDLLCFAAKHLRLGGRLVTWIPIFRSDYNESSLPSHPCLLLESNCEQVLSMSTSRRLLTFHKLREPQKEELVPVVNMGDLSSFREKFFHHIEESRAERKRKKMEQQQLQQLSLSR